MLYLGEIQRISGKEQEEMLAYTEGLVDEAIHNVRDISHNIMPGAISGLGLSEALRAFCEKIERTKAIAVHFNDHTGVKRFTPGVEIVLYRVVIELINNTLKHAAAGQIDLGLARDDGILEIRYRDNGKGFDPELAMQGSGRGIGLQNIRDRIASLEGKIDIQSAADQGVEVQIRVPV
jgi:signal transduction histidine kinase